MNPSFTPEQNKQLASWAGERDALLKVIGEKKVEAENLTKTNKELAESNTEISNKIQQSIGRLEELDRQEVNRATFVLKDVASLDERKSVLQTEVSTLENTISGLEEEKEKLHDDVEYSSKVHEAVFSRASEIEKIIGETVNLNATNAREIVNILVQAKNELKEIIDVGTQHVSVTKGLVESVPKLIVNLHRDVIERRKAARAQIVQTKPN